MKATYPYFPVHYLFQKEGNKKIDSQTICCLSIKKTHHTYAFLTYLKSEVTAGWVTACSICYCKIFYCYSSIFGPMSPFIIYLIPTDIKNFRVGPYEKNIFDAVVIRNFKLNVDIGKTHSLGKITACDGSNESICFRGLNSAY